jgi:hypothetical protein
MPETQPTITLHLTQQQAAAVAAALLTREWAAEDAARNAVLDGRETAAQLHRETYTTAVHVRALLTEAFAQAAR